MSTKKIGLFVGATILLALGIYYYTTTSGDTRIMFLKDNINMVQPYLQNPQLIVEWLTSNWMVLMPFCGTTFFVGSAIVKYIMAKRGKQAVASAVETVKSGFAGEKQQLTTAKLEAEKNLTDTMKEFGKTERINLLQEQAIDALTEEKKIQEGFILERDRRIESLIEEQQIWDAKIKSLKHDLAVERGEIQEPVP